jgi:hypothetical protein
MFTSFWPGMGKGHKKNLVCGIQPGQLTKIVSIGVPGFVPRNLHNQLVRYAQNCAGTNSLSLMIIPVSIRNVKFGIASARQGEKTFMWFLAGRPRRPPKKPNKCLLPFFTLRLAGIPNTLGRPTGYI